MADITFKTVDNSKWEKLTPVAPAKPVDKYVPILDALEAGDIVEIETKDAKEAKGLRISIGRKAALRGFKPEYRADGNTIYVKKADEPATPATPKKKKEKVTA